MTKSKKMSKMRQKFDYGFGTKYNNTSSHMLINHCFAFGLLMYPSGLKKKFVEEGGPL